MNMCAQLGGFAGALVFGYVVARTGSYNAAFIPMAALLLLGAGLWLRIDPRETLTPATLPTEAGAALSANGD